MLFFFLRYRCWVAAQGPWRCCVAGLLSCGLAAQGPSSCSVCCRRTVFFGIFRMCIMGKRLRLSMKLKSWHRQLNLAMSSLRNQLGNVKSSRLVASNALTCARVLECHPAQVKTFDSLHQIIIKQLQVSASRPVTKAGEHTSTFRLVCSFRSAQLASVHSRAEVLCYCMHIRTTGF
jgi:hypothetical protein